MQIQLCKHDINAVGITSDQGCFHEHVMNLRLAYPVLLQFLVKELHVIDILPNASPRTLHTATTKLNQLNPAFDLPMDILGFLVVFFQCKSGLDH